MSYRISGSLQGRRVSARWDERTQSLQGDDELIDELILLSGQECKVTPTGPSIPCSVRRPGQAMLLARTILDDFDYEGEPIGIEGVSPSDLSVPPGAVA
jgi:hypothetical protein